MSLFQKSSNPDSSTKRLKVLCTDFDGTLLDHDDGGSPPPAEFFEMLLKAREQGPFTWIINTGRGWEDLEHELIAKTFPIWPDWVVLAERNIFRIVDRKPQEHLTWNQKCREVHESLFDKTKHIFDDIRSFLKSKTEANAIQDSVSPLGIVAKTDAEADTISVHLDGILSDWPELSYVRNSIWFRFSHIDFNKGTCLEEIARHVDATPEEILAAGDHCNDLPMLDSRFTKGIVCPANSVDPVKTKVEQHQGYIAKGKAGHGVVEGWKYLFPQT